MPFYLDTSAAIKLVVFETRSPELTVWTQVHSAAVVSSDILRTELLRATRRGAPEYMQRARLVLDAIPLLALPSTTFERAAQLEPGVLHSLDALHLAAALTLDDELEGIVTYDERLAAAAALQGVAVVAP